MTSPTPTPQFHVDVELPDENGELRVYQMPITWDAYRRVCATGVDPAQVATGKTELTSVQFVQVVHAGLAAGGCELTEDQVGEAMVRHGLGFYGEAVGEYIGGLVVGGVYRRPAKGGGGPGNASRAGGRSRTPTKSR